MCYSEFVHPTGNNITGGRAGESWFGPEGLRVSVRGCDCAGGEEKLLAQARLSLQHTSAAGEHPHVSDSDAHAPHICLQEMTHSTYEGEGEWFLCCVTHTGQRVAQCLSRGRGRHCIRDQSRVFHTANYSKLINQHNLISCTRTCKVHVGV